MKSLKFMLAMSLAIITGFIVSACTGSATYETAEAGKKIEKKEAKKGLEIGQSAPAFEITKTDGTKASLELLRGKPTVLVFWSLYCSKCKKETPQLNQLAKEFAPRGVEVIGINTGESDEEIKKGVETFGIEYAVAPDKDKKVMQTFRAGGTPTIVFLDKEGKVQFYGNKLPEDYAGRLNSLN